MRILVIPDCHLKPWLFGRAEKVLQSGQADRALQIGDLLDDWGEQFNIALYSETMRRAIQFHKDYPDTLWVLGNHDFAYRYPIYGKRISGHSAFVEGEVRSCLREMEQIGMRQQVAHIVGGCVFTHAGLDDGWVWSRLKRVGYKEGQTPSLENIAFVVNHASLSDLWQSESPLWVRPQIYPAKLYSAKLQVGGHTPVEHIGIVGGILSTDSFSTNTKGEPYGDQKFVIVDTETGKWHLAEEDDAEA